MKEFPRVTYKVPDYTKEDLDEIFEKLLKYETDYSSKLVEIRKEQILKHSKSYFISDTLNDLANLIDREQNNHTEIIMQQCHEKLIELHSPVIFNIPINLELFHKWETWTLADLYDQYMCLAMSKGWEDYYSLVNDFSKNKRVTEYGLQDFDIDYNLIKNYHILDMLTDLILNDYKICGYELRSFMDIDGEDRLLQTFNKNSLIEVKLLDKLPIDEYKRMLNSCSECEDFVIPEAQNLDTLKDILKVNHMSNNDKNTHFRFGKFRQRMCDLLWEQGCYDISLCDEVNAGRIFNQAHKICNKLLEDYDIVEKKEDK